MPMHIGRGIVAAVLLVMSVAVPLSAGGASILPAGTPAPQISFKTQDGKSLSVQSLRGHIVIIDYWASWCGPCRMALPQLESLYRKYKKRGVVVVGLPVDDPPTRPMVPKVVKQLQITFPISVSWTANQKGTAAYNAQDLPTMFLIDRKGVVRWSGQGVYPGEETDLAAMVDYLLTEK